MYIICMNKGLKQYNVNHEYKYEYIWMYKIRINLKVLINLYFLNKTNKFEWMNNICLFYIFEWDLIVNTILRKNKNYFK